MIKFINVSLNCSGRSQKLKGPNKAKFYVDSVRSVPSEAKLCLEYLPEFSGRILFPNTGNSPLLPACMAAFNPEAKITVHEIDSHDYAAVKTTLADVEQIDFQLQPDLMKKADESQMAIFSVPVNSDRLLSLDQIERLNHIMPDGSRVLIPMAKKRYKDLIKKLNKEFKGGQVIGRSRDAVLFSGKTDKNKDKWTPRENSVKVDAIGASMIMHTRPGVFAHGRVDSGGLALYETLELGKDESLLELGCGAGLVGLLAAERTKHEKGSYDGKMVLVDSFSRSVQCAEKNIDSSGFNNIESVLEHNYKTEETFDVVAGNPPYYANHRIAEYFIKTAAAVLGEEGRLYLVSKHGDLMEELAEDAGFHCETVSRRGYDVLIGLKRY